VKILHVDTERGFRGGEQQLLYLVEGLAKRGVEQAVACRAGEELERRCRELGVEVFPLKGNQTSDLFRLGAIGKKFDAVHAHAAKAHTVAALSKTFHKKPVIYTRRVDYPPKKNFLTLLKYKKTTTVVAVAKGVKKILEEDVPFLSGKVEVIYSAVDPSLEKRVNFQKVERIKRKLKGEPLIGTFAALTPQKDIPTLIKAAELTLKEFPKARFVVFGEGKLRRKLESLIRKKGLNNRFLLYGFVKDVQNYMKALDLFVLSSQNEGIGSVILTAMILKVPVVVTNVGGLSEIVINNQTGLLVPPKSPEKLAEAIKRLLKEPKLAAELTEKARALTLERFTVEPMVDSYFKLYGEVVGG